MRTKINKKKRRPINADPEKNSNFEPPILTQPATEQMQEMTQGHIKDETRGKINAEY
jgi:hypothetical protein